MDIKNCLLSNLVVIAVNGGLRLREEAAVGHHGFDEAVRDLDVLLSRQQDLDHVRDHHGHHIP